MEPNFSKTMQGNRLLSEKLMTYIGRWEEQLQVKQMKRSSFQRYFGQEFRRLKEVLCLIKGGRIQEQQIFMCQDCHEGYNPAQLYMGWTISKFNPIVVWLRHQNLDSNMQSNLTKIGLTSTTTIFYDTGSPMAGIGVGGGSALVKADPSGT